VAERRGRLRRIGDALRRRGLPTDPGGEPGEAPGSEEDEEEKPAANDGGVEDDSDGDDAEDSEAPDDGADEGSEGERPASSAGMPARPSLGNLREERKESIRGRLAHKRPKRRRRPRLLRRKGKPEAAGPEEEGDDDASEGLAPSPWAASPGIEDPSAKTPFGVAAKADGEEDGDDEKPAKKPAREGPSRARLALRAVAAWIASAAAAVASAMSALWGVVRDLGIRVSDAWFTLSLLTRRRIAAAGTLVALVLLVVFVIVPIAPCWAPGGDRCAPDDDAVVLAPADADAYIHLNLAADTDQSEAASAIAERLPGLSTQVDGLLALATDRVIDYKRDIAPWSAGELAVILDVGFTGTEKVILIEVEDQKGADAFAENFLGAEVTETDLDGITMQTDHAGTAAATAGGFLILGPEAAVRSEVELARGRGETLDGNADYQRAEAELPDHRLADAWLSPAFSRALFGETGSAPTFDTFINAAATQGVSAALSFADNTVALSVHSLQDPEPSKASDDFFAALPAFEPTLAGKISADALAYMGLGNPAASARTLIGRAAETAPDLFKGLKRFNRNLENKDSVDLEQDLLPVLDGEAALTVEPQEPPGQSQQASTPGTIAPTSVPYLALLASGVDVDSALTDIAQLQGPIAANVDPSSGQAPIFETSEIAGVEAHSLQLSPVVDLTYAAYDDNLIVGTSPLAVDRVRADDDKLGDSSAYQEATAGLPESVSMLVYLNAKGLLGLGERLFLAEDPTYAQIAPELRTLDSVALAVRSGKTDLGTDLNITIGQPQQAETEPPPLPPTGG
jgi:hypothetical protein